MIFELNIESIEVKKYPKGYTVKIPEIGVDR